MEVKDISSIVVGEEVGGLYDKREYYEVTSDVFSISQRIKSMDPDYFILYSRKKNKYELHHKGQRDNTYALSIPYDELDERTLRLIWDTRREKFDEIIAEMNAHNEKIDRDKDEYLMDYVKWVGKETYSYVNTHFSRETVDAGAFKTRWV